MYVSRIVIRNYRNLRHLDVPIKPGATCIVGENNTGKTNFLRAIRLPIDASLSSQNRTLLSSDFSSGVDYRRPSQILVSLELQGYAGKENEEAMVASWAIADGIARITYRFRPRRAVIEALAIGERENHNLSLNDYGWEIVGNGGDTDPAVVEWNQPLGHAVRFDELQQYLVLFLHPLRDVEQSLGQVRQSPLAKLLAGSDIDDSEQDALVRILSDANDKISGSATISRIGGKIDQSFAEAAGTAFRMQVELGMAPPSFNDISRSLTVLLSTKWLRRFDPALNGLGLNNVLYVSMLLRFFEERITAGRTPGQLLLFEEPEAHLHPQLQRVLFGTLVGKEFQTIASTHSTHITSQVPLSSIIILTDDGSPATAPYITSAPDDLTAEQIADLERYLDATRGVLLYARKVLLVEGPAELFLIPPLVKAVLGIDLEDHGISVIPIFGVHFGTYSRLFGSERVRKRCAILADGDLAPSDAAAPIAGDLDDLPEPIKPAVSDLENEFVKSFVCRTTFERDITCAGTISMLVAAVQELGAPTAARRLQELAEGPLIGQELDEARDLVLRTAKRFGKARFAQVASKHVKAALVVPGYIRDAVDWLLEDETE